MCSGDASITISWRTEAMRRGSFQAAGRDQSRWSGGRREGTGGESGEAVTRSEEQPHVSGRQAEETGRARLREHVVTEQRRRSP
ncbi:hypothetical protein Mame01_40770 [Microbispora amethystogenes]|nr:hypothetical protein Mame01_40770 [Microbispora amethystogenes]